MRKGRMLLILLCLGLAGAAFGSYYYFSHHAEQREGVVVYTCPMHHQIRQDHPGNCPICGMTLVPLENHQQPKEHGAHVSQAQQDILGLKMASAELKDATQIIETSGKVSFDVDLFTAQQEFLALRSAGPELAAAAKQRLLLLGMNVAGIRELEKSGKADAALVESNQPRWVTASLFLDEAKQVKIGQKATIVTQAGMNLPGKVAALEPVLGQQSRLVQARIQLDQADKNIHPQELVHVAIDVPLGQALLSPRSALLDSGTRKLVMVQESAEHFVPREVELGSMLGDEVSIQHGLQVGEKVVLDVAFLIDAESQLKSALGR